MVPTASLRELFAGDPTVRVVAPSKADEDFGAFGPHAEDPKSVDAPTVDGEPFRLHDVAEARETRFTQFLDGAQRTWPCLYVGLLPVRLAHTSAAVVRRIEGEMLALDQAEYEGGIEAFVPDIGDYAARFRRGFEVQTVPVTEEDNEASVLERLRRAISDRRESREGAVARTFSSSARQAREEWMLVDGGIGRICGPGDERNVVGVVKTHSRQYFKSADRVALVLGMRPGQRTTLFHREADPFQGAAAYSYYLRLRESPVSSPLYGIVRVELPPREDSRARADEIASWILRERTPLSMPDPRHDRLVYPIRLVEEHLRARQPSDAAVRAIIGV